MDWDELDPRNKPQQRKNLEIMSVAELEDYIGSLEAEIVRARDAIKAKQSVRQGAEALFKK